MRQVLALYTAIEASSGVFFHLSTSIAILENQSKSPKPQRKHNEFLSQILKLNFIILLHHCPIIRYKNNHVHKVALTILVKSKCRSLQNNKKIEFPTPKHEVDIALLFKLAFTI